MLTSIFTSSVGRLFSLSPASPVFNIRCECQILQAFSYNVSHRFKLSLPHSNYKCPFVFILFKNLVVYVLVSYQSQYPSVETYLGYVSFTLYLSSFFLFLMIFFLFFLNIFKNILETMFRSSNAHSNFTDPIVCYYTV